MGRIWSWRGWHRNYTNIVPCTKVLRRKKQTGKEELASCSESRPLVVCLHTRRQAACSHHFPAADLGVHADHSLFYEQSTAHPQSPLNSLYSVSKAAVWAWNVGVLVRTTLLAEVIVMAVRAAATGFRNSSHRRNASGFQYVARHWPQNSKDPGSPENRPLERFPSEELEAVLTSCTQTTSSTWPPPNL